MLGEPVKVLLEGQSLERAREDYGADRQVAVLETADRGAGHEDARCHLSLTHAAAAAGRTEPCSQSLRSPSGIRMEGLPGSTHRRAAAAQAPEHGCADWHALHCLVERGTDVGIEDFIRSIPKAELHLHIEGTLEPELKFDLARRNGLELPYSSVAAMRAAYDFDDLPSFLAQYYEGMAVLRGEEDFYDLAMAYFTRVAAQNLVYVELFFDPQAHTGRGVEFATVIAGLQRAQQDADIRFGIGSGLIMCFLRDLSAESAAETLQQAAPYRDSIVGVGLDSDESGNPPIKFREVFAAARAQGYRLTMHCDVDQEDSVAHIWQCLDEIGVDRIDHGVNALEDEALTDEIVRRGLGLTACPISNSYVSDGTKSLEIRALLERGVLVTVNSDDPAYFPGYVAENLVALQREAKLTRDDIVRLVRNAFTVSWLEEPDRLAYLDRVDAWVAAH